MRTHGSDPEHWTVLSSTYLTRDPWLTVRQDRVRLANGTIIDDYNILEYPDWVNILAIDAEANVVLIRQYRHGIKAVHYELPAGVCESTDSDLEATARRELLEETGYAGGEWSRYMTLSANPSTHTNRSFTFLAVGVSRVQDQALEATEELQVHLASLDEVRRIVAEGGVMQALHAAPLLQYLLSASS